LVHQKLKELPGLPGQVVPANTAKGNITDDFLVEGLILMVTSCIFFERKLVAVGKNKKRKTSKSREINPLKICVFTHTKASAAFYLRIRDRSP
jgi:hypothetical protein